MECETTMSVPLRLTTRQRMASACAVYRIYGADELAEWSVTRKQEERMAKK